MQIWPAIDLRGGRCVRLVQGDYGREKVFSDDPAAMARHWVGRGARRLHLVDLDAARTGRPTNVDAVRAILSAVDVPCQLGGGIRDDDAIRELFSLGVDRLIVGTSALKQPDWFRSACRRNAGRLVLGLDARDGRLATDGWTETSGRLVADVVTRLANEPLAAIIYTDIATDGMLMGPNFQAIEQLVGHVDLPIIASGGVATQDDVVRLASLPVAGCIIGMALYEGHLDLEDVLDACGDTSVDEAPPGQREKGPRGDAAAAEP